MSVFILQPDLGLFSWSEGSKNLRADRLKHKPHQNQGR